MMRLRAPNGAEVEAAEEAVARLLAAGFCPVGGQKPEPAPKAPEQKGKTRKRG